MHRKISFTNCQENVFNISGYMHVNVSAPFPSLPPSLTHPPLYPRPLLAVRPLIVLQPYLQLHYIANTIYRQSFVVIYST